MSQKPQLEEHQVTGTLKDYIRQRGGNYNTWNIGICQNMPDIVPLLYSTHRKCWVHCRISSLNIAQKVLDQCINELGMKSQADSLYQNSGPCVIYAYNRMDTNSC
jgi:hypothetical protein